MTPARRAWGVAVLAGGLLAHNARADLLDRASVVDSSIDATVTEVLEHSLNEDAPAAEAVRQRLVGRDAVRREAGEAPTGLADQAGLVVAAIARTRDGRRDALEHLLRERPDTVVQGLARFWLDTDDAAHATRLLVDDRHNRRAHVVNDAIRPFGLTSSLALLAAVNPFILAGSALDSIATTASNVWHYNRLSTREREALVRYRTQLARDAVTTDAPAITEAVLELSDKRALALCTDTCAAIARALKRHDYDQARFLQGEADRLRPCASKARKTREAVARALAQRATAEADGRWPVAEPPLPASASEAAAYDAILRATAVVDAPTATRLTNAFLADYPEAARQQSVRLALAVAVDADGHRGQAREHLDEVADGDGSAATAATSLLATPELSGLDGLTAAERRHRRDVASFILIGDAPDGRTALYAAAQLGAQGSQAASSLGIVNVIGMAGRAWQAWRHDPISNDVIIDKGEAFLARTPTGPEASDVHERLSEAYARADNPARALTHYRATRDPDPEHVETLEAKLAETILAEAADDPLLLESLARRFPLTDAGEKARERLLELPGAGQLPIDLGVLRAEPALLGPNGLAIDPTLLDGNTRNGELADRGVALGPHTLTLYLEDEDAPRVVDLAPDTAERMREAALDALWEARLVIAERNPDVGPLEKYIPVFIQGSVGGDGSLAVAPGLKLRRYRTDRPELYE